MLKTLLKYILDLIYPQKCLICRDISPDKLCQNCQSKAFEFYGENKQLKIDLEYIGLYKYNDPLKKIIEEIKFNKNKSFLQFIETALLKLRNYFKDSDLIIPVPINPERLKERGFNQAELFIGKIACLLQIPIRNDIVYRKYNTLQSFNLNPEQRKEQAEKAFGIWPEKIPEITGKRILIFDDIITTGATVKELANVLETANPKTLKAIGLARPVID